MKFLFLIAAVYLTIEYLNYLRRKENKEESEKNNLEKAIDKAVEETKEALSTPAKKSVIDVQSLDTVLPSANFEEKDEGTEDRFAVTPKIQYPK